MRRILLSLSLLAFGCAPPTVDDPFGDEYEGQTTDALGGTPRLGVGLNAITSDDRPKVFFKPTVAGVVAAAFYELHRGERRTLADILADATAARVARGPYAAIETVEVDDQGEATGSNWDPAGAHPIATITVDGQAVKVGPIETYLRANHIYGAAPWCGSLTTFLMRRAGLYMPTLKLARNVPNVLAQLSGTYYRIDGDPVFVDPDHPEQSPVTYTGRLQEGLFGTQQNYQPATVTRIADVDLRAGDVLWWERPDGWGHVGLVVGVSRSDDMLQVITIEGNSDDRIRAQVRSLQYFDGQLVSDWKGWGRPPVLQATPQAADPDHPAAWITAAIAALKMP